jgi:hypothetical protein
MRSKPNDSAFPWILGHWKDYEPEMCEGVTKRELFAALNRSGGERCHQTGGGVVE